MRALRLRLRDPVLPCEGLRPAAGLDDGGVARMRTPRRVCVQRVPPMYVRSSLMSNDPAAVERVDIEKLRGLLDKWAEWGDEEGDTFLWVDGFDINAGPTTPTWLVGKMHNAELAHAVAAVMNAAPSLLDELEATRTDNQRLREALRDANTFIARFAWQEGGRLLLTTRTQINAPANLSLKEWNNEDGMHVVVLADSESPSHPGHAQGDN